ncbi:serine protease, trypsin family [Renibacterium salmoninarum ATCC 33209]|uniref:Serine protease, trypsin family n=1 Tax=Renibacterium salmoninarum (strain ATCC 33209 / DSM 20767 / JCM 11484 / NBRC 15589 / NCIMB 2235) TaxID=288705 RepID=A9WQU1_RENSM|nr:serine protease [Renibacterium salmoninarum]ABY23636.1 serine protease, trypsin family [Renibacterium salmoninarum ATCC 33209]
MENGNDIAILTLDTNFSGPVATLETDPSAYVTGADVTTLGWANTQVGPNPDPEQLRKVTVPLVSDSACSGSYGSDYKKGTMVCAGFEDGAKDSCDCDSGSPLVKNGRLVGVISWGHGCAKPKEYGIYARVTSFIDQINAQLGK